jgi:hypothetical protein
MTCEPHCYLELPARRMQTYRYLCMYRKRNFSDYSDNIRHHHTKCSHLAKQEPKICNVWGGYKTSCSGPEIMYGNVLGTMKLSWRKYCYTMENYMVDVQKPPAFCVAANEPLTQDMWKHDYKHSHKLGTGCSSAEKKNHGREINICGYIRHMHCWPRFNLYFNYTVCPVINDDNFNNRTHVTYL